MKRLLVSLSLLAAFLVTTPAFAAKPGSGSGTTDNIHIATINGSTTLAATSTTPKLGDTLTFGYTLVENVKYPVISVQCYQNGVNVWGLNEVAAPTDQFKLGGDSSPWLTNGGAANCVTQLVGTAVYATMSFTASGK